MKNIRIIIAGFSAAVIFFATSCSSTKTAVVQADPTPQAPVMTSSLDTVSYALGVNIGSGLRENLKTFPDGPANLDILIDALVKSLRNDTTLMMDNQAAQESIQKYVSVAEKRQAEAYKAEEKAFLDENKTREGVITTESGLQYKVITQGTGAKPTENDQVKVHYTGKLLDGTVFDSSVQRGEPATFGVTQVIKGWQEVLLLMPVGSKYQVWIPSDLAYGERGAGQMIKPYSLLEFEVELLEIVKPQEDEVKDSSK